MSEETPLSARNIKSFCKTATRHLTDLVDKGCLEKLPGGGRSTQYHLRAFDIDR